MARAQQVNPDVFAAPQQVPSRFFLLRRDVNGRQRAGAEQHRELRRIPPIRLDPIAGPPRNQGGRDDGTRDAMPDQGPLQLKPTGPGLIAALDRPLALQPFDEPEDRRAIGRERVPRRRPPAR